MGINMTDLSGTPRSDNELQDAVDAVVKEFSSMNPTMSHEIMLVFPTIMDCLKELQGFRELVRKIKAKQNQS